jgi:hypothetical protein
MNYLPSKDAAQLIDGITLLSFLQGGFIDNATASGREADTADPVSSVTLGIVGYDAKCVL